MDIKIAYLKDHSEKIPTLAKIWHEVLGKQLDFQSIGTGRFKDRVVTIMELNL